MVRGAISALLLTVTVAFGTADPEESVTTPVIFPVIATCAEMIAGRQLSSINRKTIRLLIIPPSTDSSSSYYLNLQFGKPHPRPPKLRERPRARGKERGWAECIQYPGHVK